MSKNKMEDFIKKRLTDFTPAEDGWNVPSDDLFNKAKVEFPKKEEKKKRRWFWFPLLFGALLVSGFGAYYLSNPINDSLNSQTISEQSVNEKETIETSTLLSESKTIIDTENATSNSNPIKEIIQSKSELPVNELNQSNSTSSNLSKSENEVQQIENKIQTKLGNTEPKMDTAIPTSIDQEGAEKTFDNTDTEKNTIIPSVIKRKEIENYSNNNATLNKPTVSLEKKTTLENLDSGSKEKTEVNTLLPATQLMYLNTPLSISNRELAAITLKQTQIARPYQRTYEVGIGYEERLVSALRFVNLNDDEGNDYVATSGKYFNTNVHASKWIARKWSISTGLKYSKLDLNLDFSVQDTMDTDDLGIFISQELDEAISSRSSASTSSEEGVQVELLDGFDVQAGDILTIEGDVEINFTAWQIPLLINYHIYKKRSEFKFGLGGSLDFGRAKQSAIELFVFNEEGSLINEPTIQKEDSESFTGFSIYAQTGYQFYINKNINLGLTATVDVIDPIFSGLELGFFYQWTR